MKKKSLLLATIATMSICMEATAQKWQDVTSTYLKNADFSNSEDRVTDNVPVNPSTLKNVTEWTVSGSTSWSASAAIAYGSTGTINGASVPATNPNGEVSGGCVAITGSWDDNSGFAKYEQSITLPAGQYKITFLVNNVGKNDNFRTSYFGFNNKYSSNSSFPVNTWTNDVFNFTLDEETTGNVSFGFGWNNTGSGNTPKLCIDNVKIEYLDTEAAPDYYDGTFYLYNEESGMFISRGAEWGTRATCDPFGLPVNVTNVDIDGESTSKIRFYDWSSAGLGENLYTDNGSPADFTFDGNNTDGYTIKLGVNYLKAADMASLTTSSSIDDYCLWKLITLSKYNDIQSSRNSLLKSNALTAAGVASESELSSYITKDLTSKISNASLAGSINGWSREILTNREGTFNTNSNGTEIYEGCGKLTQTISGLEKGLYKFTVQGFYRDGSNASISSATDNGYNLSCCYISANGNTAKIKSWGIDRESNSNPNSMGDFKALANSGKYKNEVFAYVGDEGTLDIEIAYPQFIGGGWAIFYNSTLTFYTLNESASAEERAALDAAITAAEAAIARGGTKGLDEFNTLIEQAKNLKNNDTSTSEQVTEMTEDLKNATDDFLFNNASSERQVDVTSQYIKNPSFEGSCGSATNTFNTPESWTLTTSASVWLDGLTNTNAPSDGAKLYNFWAGSISSLNIYQDIILPKGKYMLAADFRTDNKDNISDQGTYAKIGEQIIKTDSIIKTIAPTWDSVEGWNNLPVSFNVIENNTTVTIGASSTGNGTNSQGWFQIDNFTLKYLGNEEIMFQANDLTSPTASGIWYKTTITSEGNYSVKVLGNSASIYYTQDGDIVSTDEADMASVSDGDSFDVALTAGTLYIYASQSVTISIEPKSFNYILGNEVCNKPNNSYIKDGEIVFTFPDATTNDPSATLALNSGKKAKVNGTDVEITAVEGGFSFNIRDIEYGTTTYSITIPANTFGYAGKAENNELNYTFYSPEFADGKYYLKNTASGKWLGAGNSWGTQASLCKHGQYFTLECQNDGKYSLNSHVSNGGNNHYLGSNMYVDASVTYWIISKNGENYNLTIDENNYLGYDGSSTVVTNTITNASDNNAQWEIYSESQMKEMLNNASKENPVDATFLIEDPAFGRNDMRVNSWNTYKSGGNLNISNGGSWSFYATEAWNNTFYVEQTLSDIPNGVYHLTVQGYDSGKNAYLYANETTDTIKNSETAGNFQIAAENIGNGYYTGPSLYVFVENGNMTLGVRRDSKTGEPWCVFSNFELEYLGNDFQVAKLNIQKENKWATFYAPFDVDIPANVYSYAITVVDNKAKRIKIGGDKNYTLPAETPVLLYTDNINGFSFTYIEGFAKGEPEDVTDTNYLIGTLYKIDPMPTTTEGNVNYILMNKESNGVNWYRVSEGINSLPANRAYLSIDESVDTKSLFFDDETDINSALVARKADNSIFNLAGQKVENAKQSGIYIINGKKYFVR